MQNVCVFPLSGSLHAVSASLVTSNASTSSSSRCKHTIDAILGLQDSSKRSLSADSDNENNIKDNFESLDGSGKMSSKRDILFMIIAMSKILCFVLIYYNYANGN